MKFAVAVVELPPLLLAKNETPSPLPASDPSADGVRRILSRALEYWGKGDFDSAIADYTQVIRLDPKNAGAYSLRGMVYQAKGDYESCIADHTEAIRLEPKKAGRYCSRGMAYYGKGDYDRAIADYTESLRLDPTYTFPYYWRGKAYGDKRDYESAIADYTEAIRLDPEDALAYRGRGLSYKAKGERAAAERDFAKAKELGYEPPTPVPPERNPVGESPTPIRRVYAGTGEGHWIKKNIGRGEFIVLEDGSLWEIDRLERIDASLWLRTSDITVVESDRGSPGYDYLLINTDDGEKAHAKYMGKR